MKIGKLEITDNHGNKYFNIASQYDLLQPVTIDITAKYEHIGPI